LTLCIPKICPLFKKKEHGLYAQDFAKIAQFPKADLSHAYLVRADFGHAQCTLCKRKICPLTLCIPKICPLTLCIPKICPLTLCFPKTCPLTLRTPKIHPQFSSQTLSARIDRNTEFKFLQLEGGIDKDVIKNIENAKNYLNESASKKLQAIIKKSAP
jgi:hypothetical protein